jgi:mycothione reductase
VSDRHHDLVIIGTGSGNSIPSAELDGLDIAIVESGVFGGTCLNVGCIPTKMYVYPADLAELGREAHSLGVTMSVDSVDWPAIRDRIFGRIDPIVAEGKAYREGPECPNITVYDGSARFVGPKRLDTGTGTVVSADRFVIAAGGRPHVPDIAGLELGPRVHTSDTIMRLDELPDSIIVFGGGFVAAEFSHVFDALGSEVTQVVRSAMLRDHDRDIADTFAAAAAKRWTLLMGDEPTSFEATARGVRMELAGRSIAADAVLVATGRVPNSDRLGLETTGVDVDERSGYIIVDDFQQTTAEGIFALGDVSSPWQLKHVANHEMRVVRHNLIHPDAMIRSDHRFVPSAVFTHPQIAMVGIPEWRAIAHGINYVTARHDYGGTAAGWAREDRTGFLKVLADPASGLLLGAHIIGPEAATVIQPLIQAMHFGQTARDLATKQYWIHPALPEVIENALLKLPLSR